MNREDVLQIIREAHDWDEVPDLRGADPAHPGVIDDLTARWSE